MDTTSYTFQQEPNAAVQTWKLTGRHLTKPNGEAIDLSKVTRGKFTELEYEENPVVYHQLFLESDGKSHIITYNGKVDGHDWKEFHNLCLRVAVVLSNEAPNAEFQQTTYSKTATWIWSILGGVLLAIGLFLLWGTVNLDGLTLEFAGGPISLLGIPILTVGGLMLWWAAPWSFQPPLKPSEFAQQFKSKMQEQLAEVSK
ncbi:MAG: hypothetical protein P8Y67_06195 [Alphaproteobacteria bacterium]